MLALHIIATLFVIVLFLVVLFYFLNRISHQLRSISANLAKVTWGVRAVETQCLVIGPAADRINANLAPTAAGLNQAADMAEKLGRRA